LMNLGNCNFFHYALSDGSHRNFACPNATKSVCNIAKHFELTNNPVCALVGWRRKPPHVVSRGLHSRIEVFHSDHLLKGRVRAVNTELFLYHFTGYIRG
jgi:hypothetical protein